MRPSLPLLPTHNKLASDRLLAQPQTQWAKNLLEDIPKLFVVNTVFVNNSPR